MADEALVTRIAQLEADNHRLRRLLDQHDAPGELRHRMRSTVALLRMIIRKSTESRTDLGSYMGLLENRLDAIARVQAIADEEGVVELQKLLTDELLHYRPLDNVRVRLSGPELALQPRTGRLLALAIHELTINAIEHGSLGSSKGRVDISWLVDESGPAPVLSFVWEERDQVTVGKSDQEGFGTEVLVRMLAYELGATTSIDFEPHGLRCSIQFPLS